MQKTLDLQPV